MAGVKINILVIVQMECKISAVSLSLFVSLFTFGNWHHVLIGIDDKCMERFPPFYCNEYFFLYFIFSYAKKYFAMCIDDEVKWTMYDV